MTSITSPTGNNLYDIWGSANNDIFAVGANGVIIHYDGFSWSTMSSGTGDYLTGVWGTSDTDVFAVGNPNGTIIHYDGNTWSSSIINGIPYHPYYPVSIWGSSSTDVYVVGGYGLIMHYDVDADNDGITDDVDNCPYENNPNQSDNDGDGIGDACDYGDDSDGDGVPDLLDNCPDYFNPDQADIDVDGVGDVCDNCWYISNQDQLDTNADCPLPPYSSDPECGDSCEDTDGDDTPDIDDNCPNHPNGSMLGTCVKSVSGVVIGIGVTCSFGGSECIGTGETCQLEQGDCNSNGIGDSCECYADCDCNQKVDLADLVIMKQQFTWNCSQHTSCEADCNGDGKVDLSDLVIMKIQFLRIDCPACP